MLHAVSSQYLPGQYLPDIILTTPGRVKVKNEIKVKVIGLGLSGVGLGWWLLVTREILSRVYCPGYIVRWILSGIYKLYCPRDIVRDIVRREILSGVYPIHGPNIVRREILSGVLSAERYCPGEILSGVLSAERYCPERYCPGYCPGYIVRGIVWGDIIPGVVLARTASCTDVWRLMLLCDVGVTNVRWMMMMRTKLYLSLKGSTKSFASHSSEEYVPAGPYRSTHRTWVDLSVTLSESVLHLSGGGGLTPPLVPLNPQVFIDLPK